MDFKQHVSLTVQDTVERLTTHPFIVELYDGLLDEAIFQSFIQQDLLYLNVYHKVIVLLCESAPTEEAQMMLEAINTGVIDELQALKRFIDTSNSSIATTANLHYQKLLLDSASQNFGHGIAAILPCFLVFKALFSEKTLTHPIYSEWVSSYHSDTFIRQADEVYQLAAQQFNDACANEQREIFAIITAAANYEWAFFNAAYDQVRELA